MDELCRSSVRGSSVIMGTVIRIIMVKSHKLKFCEIIVSIITVQEYQFDTICVGIPK